MRSTPPGPDILADMAALAAEYGVRMHTHLSETRKEQLECVARHGMTPAAVMREAGVLDQPVTLAHCVWLTEPDMELLAAAPDLTVAHCVKSNLKLASGIAQVEKLRKKGIRVAIGTDSAASNNALDMLEEMRAAALTAKGVSLDPCALSAPEALSRPPGKGRFPRARRLRRYKSGLPGGHSGAADGYNSHDARAQPAVQSALRRGTGQRRHDDGGRADSLSGRGVFHHRYRTGAVRGGETGAGHRPPLIPGVAGEYRRED